MSNQIEIRIDAKTLTPEKFIEGATDFFALVEGVTKNIGGDPVNWIVEVDKGSLIVRMRDQHPSSISEHSLKVVCQGVQLLRSGAKTIPNGFTRLEVGAARTIAALVDGEKVQSISIQNGGIPEDFTKSIVSIADAILASQSHIAFGSIEGNIVSLSARHGLSCTIYDPMHRREITCYLQTKDVQKAAVEGYTKRVMASGLIHYAKEGNPVSITADSMRIFPSDSELPSLEDVQAIYRLYK